MEHRLVSKLSGFRPGSCIGPRLAGAAVTFLVVVLLFLAPSGCSSGPPAAHCGSSPPCASGDVCIEDGPASGVGCHKPCTQQEQCPDGFYCNDGLAGGTVTWCAAVATNFLPHKPGQWGAACLPGGDAVCDGDDAFGCYGVSPTDANAFCTFYECQADVDCLGGWWCAQINLAPNSSTVSRSFGATDHVCLPRQYCAPCRMDHDCPAAQNGTPQHCVLDSNGSGFCSPQCSGNDTCPLDAVCAPQPWNVCAALGCKTDDDCAGTPSPESCFSGSCHVACQTNGDCPPSNGAPQHCSSGACVATACVTDDDCPASAAGYFQHCAAGACQPECAVDGDCNPDQTCAAFSVCKPRAGVCVGDGSFCSPCRSDADCTNGECLDALDSSERFCSQALPSGTACTAANLMADACPAPPGGANYRSVSCTQASNDFSPASQCFGEVMFAGQLVPGCWTVNR